MHCANLLRRNRIISIRRVSPPVQKVMFSLINWEKGWGGWGGHGGHTVVAQQQGRGPRPCSTEGVRRDDRHTDMIHPLYNDLI